MSDNGAVNVMSLDEARKVLAQAKEETTNEPPKAADVPLTAEQRAQRCQAVIQDVLNEYRCVLVGSWEQIADNQQIRSASVQIVALDEKA